MLYQLVQYKGQTYCLARLGSELDSVPKVLVTVLKSILGKMDRIRRATNSYIDDNLGDKTVVLAMEVVRYLKEFELIVKPPDSIAGEAVLILKLQRDKTSVLVFRSEDEIPELGTDISRREFLLMCRKLAAHYPITGL